MVDTVTSSEWNYCQQNSNSILLEGLKFLTSSTQYVLSSVKTDATGIYIIYFKNLRYIGETKNLTKRISQHSKKASSSFYRAYNAMQTDLVGKYKNLEIEDFNVKFLETKIGRKELEEFGIVNLPAKLNKFHKDKRELYNADESIDIWEKIQENADSLFKQGEEQLMNKSLTKWKQAEFNETAGLYWIEKDNEVIYVGESTDLLGRWNTHSRTTYFSALRRNIGRQIFNFSLKTKKGKKKYFTTNEDAEVTKYLKSCRTKSLNVSFGRLEFEEWLIKSYSPILNRKGR